MGDSPQAADGLAGPTTKKRVASRQISKDDNFDVEEESGVQDGATFQRASEEVLAARKFLKVRRTAATATPSVPNPFAGIRLVPPTATTDQEEGDVAYTGGLEAHSGSGISPPKEETPVGGLDAESIETVAIDKNVAESPTGCREVAVEGSQDFLEKKLTGKEEQNGKSPEKPLQQETTRDINVDLEKSESKEFQAKSLEDKVEERKAVEQAKTNNEASVSDPEQEIKENPGEKSSVVFGQLFSSKSPFSGLGTGFSTSSFSFGSTQLSTGTSGFASFSSVSGFGSGSAFANKGAVEGGFSSMSSVFEKSNGAASFQFSGSQLNTTPLVVQPTSGGVSLQEVPLETGEEQEKVVFSADATLFEFLDGGWKERGKGDLKVNVPEENGRRPRLVMRSKGNYRLLLNASLFPDMKLTSMDSRGVTFACMNSAIQEKEGFSTYAVRLKDSLAATGFREAVDSHKGKFNVNLKTPENSPRALQDSARDTEASKQ